MSENPHEAWDPRSPAVLTDQIAAYDSMRRQTPIAYSDFLGWFCGFAQLSLWFR